MIRRIEIALAQVQRKEHDPTPNHYFPVNLTHNPLISRFLVILNNSKMGVATNFLFSPGPSGVGVEAMGVFVRSRWPISLNLM